MKSCMFQNYTIPEQNRKAAGQIKTREFLKQSVFRNLYELRSHHSRTMNYFLRKKVLICYTSDTLINVGRELQ